MTGLKNDEIDFLMSHELHHNINWNIIMAPTVRVINLRF